MGPHAARALRTASRIDAGSPALAGNAAASMRLPFRAVTPAASLSSLRATSATEKPEAPNFSATALEMPGPNPTTRIVFPTCPPMMCAMLRLPHVETARQVVLSKATDQRGGAQLSSSLNVYASGYGGHEREKRFRAHERERCNRDRDVPPCRLQPG